MLLNNLEELFRLVQGSFIEVINQLNLKKSSQTGLDARIEIVQEIIINKIDFSKHEADFTKILKEQFNFDDQDCKTIYKIYVYIYQNEPKELREFIFLRLFGNAYYNSQNLTGKLFKLMIGCEDFLDYLINKVGIPEIEARRLFLNIRLQHNYYSFKDEIAKKDIDSKFEKKYQEHFKEYLMCTINPNTGIAYTKEEADLLINDQTLQKQYEDYINSKKGFTEAKSDFAHQMITAAFIESEKDFLSLNDSNGFDDEAGWYGDIIGFPFIAPPSAGSKDYISDLDAVNINKLRKPDETYVEAMNRYYKLLNEGKINRAELFLQNVPNFWDTIRSSVPSDFSSLPLEEMIEGIENPDTYNFAKSILNKSNELITYRPSDGTNQRKY